MKTLLSYGLVLFILFPEVALAQKGVEPVVEISDKAELSNFIHVFNDSRAYYHTQVLINAPVEKVWATATNFEDMSWSPTFRGFVGETSNGSRAEAQILVDGTIKPYLHEIDWIEGRRFGWSEATDFGEFLHDNHMYLFVPVGDDQTLVLQTDDATNTAPEKLQLSSSETVSLMKSIVGGYMGFNQALKAKVEGTGTIRIGEPEVLRTDTTQVPNLIKVINKNRAIVYTEVLIEAPVETVWKVATDFKNMEWSPSFRGFKGRRMTGSDIMVEFADFNNSNGGKSSSYPLRLTWVEGQRFGWAGQGVMGPALFDNHMFLFVPIDSNTTLFIQSDDATSTDPQQVDLSSEAVVSFLTTVVRDNYMAFNRALKKEAESRR